MYKSIEIIIQCDDYIINKIVTNEDEIRYKGEYYKDGKWHKSMFVYGTFEAAMIDIISCKFDNDSYVTPYICKMLGVKCYGNPALE